MTSVIFKGCVVVLVIEGNFHGLALLPIIAWHQRRKEVAGRASQYILYMSASVLGGAIMCYYTQLCKQHSLRSIFMNTPLFLGSIHSGHNSGDKLRLLQCKQTEQPS